MSRKPRHRNIASAVAVRRISATSKPIRVPLITDLQGGLETQIFCRLLSPYMLLHEACCQDLRAPSCYTRAVVCPIEYTVSLREPQTQTASIRMIVRGLSSATFDVALPVWRPGKYTVINPAGAV